MEDNKFFRVLRIFLSIAAVFAIVILIILFTAYNNTSKEHVREVVTETATDAIIDQAIRDANTQGELNFPEIYEDVISRCAGQETIFYEDSGIEIDCAELRELGPEGVEQIFRQEVSKVVADQIQEEVKVLDDEHLNSYFAFGKGVIIALGILSSLLVLGIVLFSIPKYKSLFDLGIIGLFAGAPFLIFLMTSLSWQLPSTASPAIDFLHTLSSKLALNFGMVFGSGAILLVLGIILNKKVKNDP